MLKLKVGQWWCPGPRFEEKIHPLFSMTKAGWIADDPWMALVDDWWLMVTDDARWLMTGLWPFFFCSTFENLSHFWMIDSANGDFPGPTGPSPVSGYPTWSAVSQGSIPWWTPPTNPRSCQTSTLQVPFVDSQKLVSKVLNSWTKLLSKQLKSMP